MCKKISPGLLEGDVPEFTCCNGGKSHLRYFYHNRCPRSQAGTADLANKSQLHDGLRDFPRQTQSAPGAVVVVVYTFSPGLTLQPSAVLSQTPYVSPDATVKKKNSTSSPHDVLFMCFVCISEQQRLLWYTTLTDRFFFITETKSVYCAVRTGHSL